MKLCVDGEITIAGRTVFEIAPSAIRFSVPKPDINIELPEEL